jgi:hypothetical protein
MHSFFLGFLAWATVFIDLIAANETLCAQGQIGQLRIGQSQAQTAVNVFMRTVGCPTTTDVVTIAHSGGIVDITNGIHVILVQSRAEATQINCQELSSQLQFLITSSGCIDGFGGAITVEDIWAVAILTPSVPQRGRKRDAEGSHITGAMPIPTAQGMPHLAARQESTSSTVVTLNGGVTATLELIGPTVLAADTFTGDSQDIINALALAQVDALDITGFGNNFGMFVRDDIGDEANPGSIELVSQSHSCN